MEIEKEFYRQMVADWKIYYINFRYLNSALSRMELLATSFVRQKSPESNSVPAEKLMSPEDLHYFDQLRNDFQLVFEEEIIKFSGFYKLCFRKTLRPKLVQLYLNWKELRQLLPGKHKRSLQFKLETALRIFYRELALFQRYYDQNTTCINFLCRRYKQITSKLVYYDEFFVTRIHNNLQHSFVVAQKPEFDRIKKTVERLYTLVQKENSSDAVKTLKSYAAGRQFTIPQAVTMGIFIGILILGWLVVTFLLHELDFFNENGSLFVKYNFPIFRGTLLVALYMMLTGFAVFIWQRYNINYQRALAIEGESLGAFPIFRLGFGYLCLWILAFIYCAFTAINIRAGKSFFLFSTKVANWLPPALYGVFFAYLLFPSKQYLYADSRIYILGTVGNLCLYLFKQLDTKTGFAAHQITSFKGFLRDLVYTGCYSVNLYKTGHAVNTCTEQNWYFNAETIINFLPFSIGLSQTFRRFFSATKRLDRLKALLGFCKTSFTFFTVSVFHYRSNSPFKEETSKFTTLKYFSLFCSVVNTISAYIWDIKKNWQLLDSKTRYPLLRKALGYPHVSIYYVIIGANLIGRAFWSIQLLESYKLFSCAHYRRLFAIVQTFVEMSRRTIWNIMKVEVIHLRGIGNFNVVQPLSLPHYSLLDEVRALPTLENEYREALNPPEFREFDIHPSETPLPETNQNLDYSFTEEELRKFASDRYKALTSKGDRLSQRLTDVLPSFGHSNTANTGTVRKQVMFHRQPFPMKAKGKLDESIDEKDMDVTPLGVKEPAHIN